MEALVEVDGVLASNHLVLAAAGESSTCCSGRVGYGGKERCCALASPFKVRDDYWAVDLGEPINLDHPKLLTTSTKQNSSTYGWMTLLVQGSNMGTRRTQGTG